MPNKDKQNWLQRMIMTGAMAENPAVMTASGYRPDKEKGIIQDKVNDEDVKGLRKNLVGIGATGAGAMAGAGTLWKVANNPVVSAGVDIYNNYKNEKTFFTTNNLIATLGVLPMNTKLGFRAIDPSKLNDNKNRKKIYDLIKDKEDYLFDYNDVELPINKKKSLFRPDGTFREFNSSIDSPLDYDDESLIITQKPLRKNKDILIELGDRGYDLVTLKKIKSAPTIAISDKDYLDAIDRGDIREALRMRLQNFINKNLNQKYYRPDRPWFHMTNSEFVKFDPKKTGGNFRKLSRRFMRPTYYFGANPNYEYGDKMKKVLIKSSPIIDVDSRTSFYPYRPKSNSVLSTAAGADLIELAVFDPKLIKSYDAITYDDYGNIIPLSMRDNFKINDIRY